MRKFVVVCNGEGLLTMRTDGEESACEDMQMQLVEVTRGTLVFLDDYFSFVRWKWSFESDGLG